MRSFKSLEKERFEWLGTAPVPTAPYYDEGYFAAEREAVFRRTWLNVGRESDVPAPGDFIVREIELCGASILIVRGADSRLRAFHNVCSHRSTILVWEAKGRAAAFGCRYHRWTYGLDGSLRSVPDEANFFGLDKRACALTPVALESCAGFLFINLQSTPDQSLREFLGGMAEVLDAVDFDECSVHVEFKSEIHANWKTAYDNFQDTYHLRFVHPKSLVGRVTGRANPFGYPISLDFHGPHRRMALWGNLEHVPAPVEAIAFKYGGLLNQPITKPAERASNDARDPNQSLIVHAVFPNQFINVGVGTFFTHQFWPLSPDRTLCEARIYVPKAKTAGERISQEYSISAARDIWAEDWRLVEETHRGVKSGARTTLHYQAQEAVCRHHYISVNERVTRYLRDSPSRAQKT